MIKLKDIYENYRETFRAMIKKSRDLYGKNVIDKLHDNGQTNLHTGLLFSGKY